VGTINHDNFHFVCISCLRVPPAAKCQNKMCHICTSISISFDNALCESATFSLTSLWFNCVYQMRQNRTSLECIFFQNFEFLPNKISHWYRNGDFESLLRQLRQVHNSQLLFSQQSASLCSLLCGNIKLKQQRGTVTESAYIPLLYCISVLE
jgi:hypothetical protein